MIVQLLDKDGYPHIFNTDYFICARPDEAIKYKDRISYKILHAPDSIGSISSYIDFENMEKASIQLRKLLTK